MKVILHINDGSKWTFEEYDNVVLVEIPDDKIQITELEE